MDTGNNATKDASPAIFGQPWTMLKLGKNIANCKAKFSLSYAGNVRDHFLSTPCRYDCI